MPVSISIYCAKDYGSRISSVVVCLLTCASFGRTAQLDPHYHYGNRARDVSLPELLRTTSFKLFVPSALRRVAPRTVQPFFLPGASRRPVVRIQYSDPRLGVIDLIETPHVPKLEAQTNVALIASNFRSIKLGQAIVSDSVEKDGTDVGVESSLDTILKHGRGLLRHLIVLQVPPQRCTLMTSMRGGAVQPRLSTQRAGFRRTFCHIGHG